MKKFLSIILCLTFILSCFVGCTKSGTKETEPGSSPASDFVYRLNDERPGILIEKYIGASEDVVIPSHIDNLPVIFLWGVPDKDNPTIVTEGVFEGTKVRSVAIPKTVGTICHKCFKDCENLESVKIASDSSLKYISKSAFENCVKLKEIDLTSTQVKEIGACAFSGCSSLKNVIFSNTLESIREKALYECSSLTEVDLPESLRVMETESLGYCTSLKKIVIPTKLDINSIGNSIIHDVPNIKTIVFREGRTSIKGQALIQAYTNVEIIVPESVKEFSPLPFDFYPPAQIIITFLGDAPTIVEDTDHSCIRTIKYNPEKSGWEFFAWKGRYAMEEIR